MTEIERIHDQLRRVFEGESWHGPSVREALAGVTAAQAAAHPIPGVHSIWELTLHIAAWEDIARRRLGGEKVDATPEMDWPPVGEVGDAAWASAIDQLSRGHAALRETITRFDPAKLDLAPSGSSSTAYVLMHGAIQHDVYHAGQISLLKKGGMG